MLIFKYWELDFVNCTAAAAAFERWTCQKRGVSCWPSGSRSRKAYVMASSHHSCLYGLIHNTTANIYPSARLSIANHSGSSLQQQQQQQQQSGSVQILRVTLLVPLLPCTWGAARQMKQSMCDLRDTCSLYGRDQYLIGMMVTSFYLLLLPLARRVYYSGNMGDKNGTIIFATILPHYAL